MSGISKLLVLTAVMTVFIGGLAYLSQHFTLGSIKANTVGNGQHGTARWITPKEKRITYTHVPFRTEQWRKNENRPTTQGLVLGCENQQGGLCAIVDRDDVHCLMIGASGVGKTAFFLITNLCKLSFHID